jgi:N-acetylglutamate synthase-like GNAT family acetyltransferase
MQIRKATADDFPAIVELIKQFPDKLMQDHLPDPEEFTVAIEDGRVIGCSALEIYSKRLAEIRSLAVSADFQGKGIASKLIESCVSEAKDKGIYEVLSITGSSSLFEKQGFGPFNNEKYALLKILG